MTVKAMRRQRTLARIGAQDDVKGWRDMARGLIHQQVHPDNVDWQVNDVEQMSLLPGLTDAQARAAPGGAITVSPKLLKTINTALLHRDPARFSLAYRLVWREQLRPGAHRNPADGDVLRLNALAKSVRRDIHKMHAFVRFRRVETGNGERYIAWFEPDHHIEGAVAKFFAARFTAMHWTIITPKARLVWDGATLHFGLGGSKADCPDNDAVEAEWREYYASIFNPARIKIGAMKSEMPVKYWKNLPEAALIDSLVRESDKRVRAMVAANEDELSILSGNTESGRKFTSLDDLNRWFAERDEMPSTGFSETLVFGEGAGDAAIMLVGEQPGDREDRQGRPFVGPAGQMLDKALEEAGIERGRTYVTNAVKRFKFSPRGKRRLHQKPSSGDIQHYRPWLEAEISLIKPRVIVPMGASALGALTGTRDPLSRWRGEAVERNGMTMLATVHPSFLLRLPDEQARQIEYDRFVRELKLASQAA